MFSFDRSHDSKKVKAFAVGADSVCLWNLHRWIYPGNSTNPYFLSQGRLCESNENIVADVFIFINSNNEIQSLNVIF